MWLVKSEPETWSWQQMTKSRVTPWDGVRNYQATNHLKAMKVGDLCFFYHSGKERQIVGLVKVAKAYYPDPKEPRFGMVDMEFFKDLPKPVTLERVKADPRLKHLALVRQSRLSVMPVDEASWKIICDMGGLT